MCLDGFQDFGFFQVDYSHIHSQTGPGTAQRSDCRLLLGARRNLTYTHVDKQTGILSAVFLAMAIVLSFQYKKNSFYDQCLFVIFNEIIDHRESCTFRLEGGLGLKYLKNGSIWLAGWHR